MAFIDDIKNYFKKGLKPSQSQFWSWMDKIYWRDQSIPVGKITIGEAELTSGSSIAWDVDALGTNARVLLEHNATLTLSNLAVGQFCQLVVQQDDVGGRTLSITGAKVAFNKLGVTELSAGADAIDTVGIYKSDFGLLVIYNLNYT